MADSTQIEVEPEVLRIQMEESREALTHKIEMLEEKVTETVQTATASVAEATANVLETVQSASASVSETVDSVTHAVQGTVDTVRHSMEDTVDSVKGAFDLSRQVHEHPWLMMGGAVAVGFFGATLLGSSGSASSSVKRWGDTPKSASDRFEREPSLPSANSFPPSSSNGSSHGGDVHGSAPSWLNHLSQMFGPEISKLESLAVGVMLGSVRDMVVDATPKAIQPQIQEVFNSFTEKMGGQSMSGSVFTSPKDGVFTK